MIGPSPVVEPHPRSLLKRKLPPPPPEVEDVCSYETIYELLGEGPGGLTSLEASPASLERVEGSPASLESGYQTSPQEQDASDEDSNLSWLLNFKVSSLFDPAEDRPPAKQHTNCVCAGTGHQRSGPGKPPFTYTELIEKALTEQGELTVSGIYTWISTNYSYYNPSDDRWKNSVRHNLSINPHFRKGVKSRQGAGHLWTLSNEGVNPPPDSWKRCRTNPTVVRSPSPMLDEAAVAVANIMQPSPLQPDPDTGLHRVAEEILSGVKRQVEVQYLVHERITNGCSYWMGVPDHTIILQVPQSASFSTSCHPSQSPLEFLNPVSKEELVSESGLDTSHCEATSSLLSELSSELHLPDNLFSDELAFTCYSQL